MWAALGPSAAAASLDAFRPAAVTGVASLVIMQTLLHVAVSYEVGLLAQPINGNVHTALLEFAAREEVDILILGALGAVWSRRTVLCITCAAGQTAATVLRDVADTSADLQYIGRWCPA